MIEKHRKTIALVFLLLIFGGCLAFFSGRDSNQETEGALEPLKVTVFKVGKADAIVLQTGKETMVIDAGEEEDGEEIVEFLENQNLSKVDVLIITHFDRDHVGGADILVEKMEIGRVLIPAYQGGNTEYMDFMNALEQKELSPQQLIRPEKFEFGEAVVSVEPPTSYELAEDILEYDNNFSLITSVTHGENKLLFMGDAQKARIREWLEGESAEPYDFLKVPHHGVYDTALKELLLEVQPEYAVICSSKKNPADAGTLELLSEKGVRTFQTKDGNITVISDGKTLELRQELERER